SLEIGIIAVLVGYLAGQGAKLGAGPGRGVPFQVASVSAALLGLLAAKYFIFAHFLAADMATYGLSAGPFNKAILEAFPAALPKMVSVFDLLWIFFAVSSAWRPLAPT